MVILTRGYAAPTRIARMAVAMINSISVNPCCWRATTKLTLRMFIALFINQLLNRNRRLRSAHCNRLHRGVPRSAPGDGQSRLALPLRHERERHHRALSRNAPGARRPRGRDLQRAGGGIVAMH